MARRAATSATVSTSSRTPNGLIAPFWDDFYSIDATTAVRAATLGTMPTVAS